MDCDLRRFYDSLRITFSGRTEIISANFMTDIRHISDEKLRDVSFMKFFRDRERCEEKNNPRMCRRNVSLRLMLSVGSVRSARRENFSCDFKFVLNSLKPLRRDTIRVEYIFPLIDIPLCSHYRLSRPVTPHHCNYSLCVLLSLDAESSDAQGMEIICA